MLRSGVLVARLGTVVAAVGASLRSLGDLLEPNDVSERALQATAGTALTRT